MEKQRIGLLAGAGEFPITFAQAAQRQGLSVSCVAIDGMASPILKELCDVHTWVGLAKIGAAIRAFRRSHVKQAVMAGKIEKVVLFHPYRIFKLLPDLRTLHMWFTYASRDKKDDTLLSAVIKEFERDEIKFGSALEYCPELLVKRGFLTRKKPSPAQWSDIRFGWELAREMGRLDVGQSVAVKDTAVLAVEAIEGTDRCIRRAGELCRSGGFTLIKVAKPQQDMRFDVPTIGQQTVNTMAQSGGKILAIECQKTIVINQEETVRLANKLGIIIVALDEVDVAQQKLSA